MGKLTFIEHLIYYLSSGVSLQDALLLMPEKHQKLGATIQQLLHQGYDIFDAFEKEMWPRGWLVLFYFFYQTRPLEQALQESLNLYLKQKEEKRMMIQKLSYPVLLMMMAMMIGLFFSYFLMPQMIALKETLSIKSMLMDSFIFVFGLFPQFLVILILILTLLCILVALVLKQPKWLLRRLLLVPILKQPIQYMITVKFSLYYKEMLKKGLTNGQVLDFLASQQVDQLIMWVSQSLRDDCLKGQHLLDVLTHASYFLESFKAILPVAFRVKEQIVVIEHYLAFEQKHYEKTVALWLKILLPTIFLIIGAMMIFIYMSFLLPMTSVIEQI